MLDHLIRFVPRRPLSPSITSFANSPLRHRASAATPAANYTDMAHDDNDPKEPSSGESNPHPFGEAYSTRSDDEGFGGIYGGNQAPDPDHDQDQDKDLNDDEHDRLLKNINKKGQPGTAGEEFDKTQGSEVAEKEKARGQK